MSKSIDNRFSGLDDDSFDVRIVRTEFAAQVPRWHYVNVSARTWRFYWNPEPGAEIIFRGRRIALTPDYAVLIPPYTPFGTDAVRPFAHLFAHFTLPEPYIAARRELLIVPSRSILPPDLGAILPELDTFHLKFAVRSLILAMLARTPEGFFAAPGEAVLDAAVQKAMSILSDSVGNAPVCEELARRCGLSVNRLHIRFRRVTGLPIKTWLTNLRMERASQLLLRQKSSIKEIAGQLGFADRYHFSKAFKHFFGVPPARFRRSGGVPLP